jgi:hypothetical protein
LRQVSSSVDCAVFYYSYSCFFLSDL